MGSMGYHGDSYYKSLLEEERAMHANEEDGWLAKRLDLEARIEYLEEELVEKQEEIERLSQDKEFEEYSFEEENQHLKEENEKLRKIVLDILNDVEFHTQVISMNKQDLVEDIQKAKDVFSGNITMDLSEYHSTRARYALLHIDICRNHFKEMLDKYKSTKEEIQ